MAQVRPVGAQIISLARQDWMTFREGDLIGKGQIYTITSTITRHIYKHTITSAIKILLVQ